MSQKAREENTSESQAVDYSEEPQPIIKRDTTGVIDQVKKMLKEDEEEKDQVMQQLTCLQQQVWEAFEECEKKLRAITLTADTNNQLLSEYFQDMYHFLQNQTEVSLKSTENLEAKLTDLSLAVAKLLEEVTIKKPKRKHIPTFMERVKVFTAQLKEMETMKGLLEGCVSPLQIHEWRGLRHVMKPAPDPLQFDPDSANPYLNLSTDLRQVKLQLCAEERKDRTYCFEPGLYVLALPGFKSDAHYWEVDVGRKSNWIIGTVMRSVERKGERELSPKNGYFVLCKQQDGEYYGTGSSPLNLKTSPIRIGVCLDLIRGRLAFYDADTTHLIYELHCPLHEELFALFCPGVPTRVEDWCPMKLCS
ncbi:nuclear factor 7, ovary [Xenopus laevis]|uniref:Nuclear factor 7, ovary n=2 Tax=Xenopus laevis TaxID=8355 RepID=A0A1L8ERV6_XENLA|nr:nuclear factor 7, ovary [Xenopus laevis]XP_041433002.1 nuclear factor 7, ovary [Xenopus laevis]OCT62077.1 hypothetical protein XELAEV_18043161mg [Xenopus laevis]